MHYYRTFIIWVVFVIILGCKEKRLIDDDGFVLLNSVEIKSLVDGSVSLKIEYKIKKGFHIQLFEVGDPNLIPTEFSFELPPDLELVSQNIEFTTNSLTFDGITFFNVISDKLVVYLIIANKFKPPLRNGPIKIKLAYQACDDKKCYFPRNFASEIPIKIRDLE